MDQRIIAFATYHGENFRKAQDDAIYKNFLIKDNLKEFYHLIKYYEAYIIIPESISGIVDGFDPYQTINTYENLSYDHIRSIATDTNPLSHWEELRGIISVTDHNVLRFILEMKVPLEKFIRFELAASGIDQYGRNISFEKAEALWMK